MVDESMSYIRFQTTPKACLPPYSYKFMNLESLGTYINNVACYKLGNMLYLDIKKRKGTMKTAVFQQQIGGTEACTKRLIMAKKGVANYDTYIADIWFIGV